MDFKQIADAFPYKTELHAHTSPVSRCSEIPVPNFVENYISIGCNSIVITNHLTPEYADPLFESYTAEYYLSDYFAACEYAKDKNINIILGAEIRFTENINDYLVYGITPEDIERIIPLLPYGIENFYKEFKNDKNVILQAHPFRKKMELAPLGSIDGIESMNMHPGHNSAVAVAAKYARDNDLLVCGGTDYHHPGHHGMCMMRTESALRDSFDVAEAIKSKNFLLDISGHLIIPYLK